MSKFKVGDKVRIRKNLKVNCYYDDYYFNLGMGKYRGKTAIIKSCTTSHLGENNYKYNIDIDNGDWSWSDSMLKKVGNKISFKSLLKNFVNKKEILNKAERKYLSTIIKPFKKEVASISLGKVTSIDRVFILIRLNDSSSIMIPFLEKKSVYKGMTLDKEYTLKELGLD